jgi:hypothetical protein
VNESNFSAYYSSGISNLEAQLGQQVFQLTGQDNQFPVSQERSAALRAAALGQARIRLANQDGKLENHLIDYSTIKAWQVIYQADSTS